MATAEDLKRDWLHDVGEVTLLPDPEPAEIWCPIISVDDHVLEPFSLFEEFGARGMADRLPRVDLGDEQRPQWIIGEERHAIVMSNACVGRPHSEWAAFTPQRYEDFRRGTWDIPERIRDMDLIGLWASLCFPSMPWGFCGTAFLRMGDRDAGLEALRAYNRWMLDGWCAQAPDRFIPCQLPWLADPLVAAQEVRANARLGFRAVSFTENPEPLGLPSIHSSHWDPFLAACEETGTVLNLHVGSSGTVQRPSTETPSPAILALFPLNSVMAVVDWVFAKVPIRFPELRIVLSEGGANWVPMVVERLQRSGRILDTPGSNWSSGDPDPVELLRRSFWFASLEDPLAFRLLDVVGEDRLMVESDYPHGDSTWPGTQALLRSETEGVLSQRELRKVCFGNAAALYDHPEPPVELLAASVSQVVR